MTKEPPKKSTKAIVDENGNRVTPKSRLPAARRVEAPPCTSCLSGNTFIYAVRGIIRYCKCRRCGHSYPHVPATDVSSIDDIQTR